LTRGGIILLGIYIYVYTKKDIETNIIIITRVSPAIGLMLKIDRALYVVIETATTARHYLRVTGGLK